MKKLLFIYIFFQFLAFAGNAQIKLIGNITTNGVANYPTHIDSLGKGGYMVMPTISGRDGIPTLRRKFGMLVFVQEVDSLYKLNSRNLDNTGWMALNVSSSSDASMALAGKLNLSDTSAMLANYLSLINALVADTTTIQPRFDLKLNASDTIAIKEAISALNADTLSLGQRITNLQNSIITTSQQISSGVTGDLATKVNYSDTAAMLDNYRNSINSLITDTIYLSNRINALTTSSGTSSATFLDSVNKRLQLKDTSGMLANYRTTINSLIVDSNTLIARFANKLNFKDTATLLSKRDTASMLKPYMDNLKALNNDTLQIASQIATIIAKLDSTGASIKNSNTSIDLKLNITDTVLLLQKKDTASLSSRIESANMSILQRLKITDTAIMLSNRFARDTANLSIRADRNEQAIIDSSTSLNNKIVSNNILANTKLNISDTANMLLSYKSKLSDDSSKIASLIADTVIIGSKITANTQAIIDTAVSLDARKLNISDTAAMLSSRFARDTASLSNRINSISVSSGTDKNTFLDSVNNRLQLRDTAGMLANYRTNINALIADTVSLALRISQFNSLANTKLAIADTSNMLSNRFARDTASLSKRIDQLNISSGISSTIFLDSVNKRLQLADTAAMLANYRKNVNALLADTATLVARFGQKLNITDTSSLLQKRDTAAMLSSRFGRDTASLSYRISLLKTSTGVSDSLFNAEIVKRVKYSDTGAMLLYYKNNVTALVADTATLVARFGQKLNITDTSSLLQKGDTAAMLSSRFARDTASLSNRINKLSLDNVVSLSAFQDSLKTRLQLADTANMLANYRNNINALITDTGTLVARFGQKLNISDSSSLLQKRDTAAMLSNRFARDTASLSKRIDSLMVTQGVDRATFIDSVNKRLQIKDTAAMLANYRNNINSLIADTLYLSNKIAGLSSVSSTKLNISDTASMLTNYRTNINALITDTGTLVARFGQKLNTSDTSNLLQKRDTAAMLSSRFARDTSFLSKRINDLVAVQGVDRLTFLDSVNKRLQLADTANMLANYRNNIISLINDTNTLATRFNNKLNSADTLSLSNRINILKINTGVTNTIFIDSINKRLQLSDTAAMLSSYQSSINALITDTNTLSIRFSNKLNITDTSRLLQKGDTITLSNRININKQAIIDSASALSAKIYANGAGKLNISDTAAMLANYRTAINSLIVDTISLASRLATNKQAIIDSASALNSRMIASGLQSAGKLNISDTSYLLQKKDTLSLSTRINVNKQAIIDSAISLNTKVNALIADTNTLKARFDAKLNFSDTTAIFNSIALLTQGIVNTASAKLDTNKLSLKDTASMLLPYQTKINSLISDTNTLATRFGYKLNTSDTAAMGARTILILNDSSVKIRSVVNLKLNTSDTAIMLSTRFARDTASLSKRIDNITTTPIILGTTSMALGATIPKVAGLSKISTDSLNIKAGAYTTQNAVLTSDASGNASWSTNGLYTLNGISANGQTFATSTSGNTFTVTSSGSVHTFNIPMASVAGTTDGLISNADYTNFNRTDVTDETGIAGFAGNSSNGNFTYTLSQTPSAKSKVKMYINGVRISNGAYSLGSGANARVITYTAASNGGFSPSSGDRVQFDYFY